MTKAQANTDQGITSTLNWKPAPYYWRFEGMMDLLLIIALALSAGTHAKFFAPQRLYCEADSLQVHHTRNAHEQEPQVEYKAIPTFPGHEQKPQTIVVMPSAYALLRSNSSALAFCVSGAATVYTAGDVALTIYTNTKLKSRISHSMARDK